MRGGDTAPLLGRGSRPWIPFLLLVSLCSCAHRPGAESGRPPDAPPVRAPYSAKIQLTAEARGRGLSMPAGVAVDPAGFARVELRDPMGATILVLALSPHSGRLLSPGLRQEALWDKATETLPWDPSDLWCLLSGVPTGASLSDPQRGHHRASWRGPFGKVRFRSVPSQDRAFPPEEASLRGPGAARLAIAWRTVYPGPPPPEALLPPPPATEQVLMQSLLDGLFR